MARASEQAPGPPLSAWLRHLVRIAGAIAGSDEGTVRAVMLSALSGAREGFSTSPAGGGSAPLPLPTADSTAHSPPAAYAATHSPTAADFAAIEEVILQSYLFAGFPRALNAMRIWRSVSEKLAPERDAESDDADLEAWRERGERTCEIVYGESYDRLRRNIRALHPALDEWMIVDGYGKVLARPGLDLLTRELCVVAACAVAGQQRQLHSHMRGAINAGASSDEVGAVLDAIEDLVARRDLERYRQLLVKVLAQ